MSTSPLINPCSDEDTSTRCSMRITIIHIHHLASSSPPQSPIIFLSFPLTSSPPVASSLLPTDPKVAAARTPSPQPSLAPGRPTPVVSHERPALHCIHLFITPYVLVEICYNGNQFCIGRASPEGLSRDRRASIYYHKVFTVCVLVVKLIIIVCYAAMFCLYKCVYGRKKKTKVPVLFVLSCTSSLFQLLSSHTPSVT